MLRSALAVMAVVAAFAETIEVARFAIPYFVFLNFSEASVAARLPFGFHLSSSALMLYGTDSIIRAVLCDLALFP
jgi:hypothetical protein